MLHVLTGALCNNNCVFCAEADREERYRHVSSQSPEHIREMIRSYDGRDEVMFTSGEPTLNENLPDYVEHGRSMGYRTVSLISNGRRFAYADFGRGLVRRGLDKVTISIHGHTRRLHEGLTRTPGSFEQTVAGIRNLVELRKERNLVLHSSTVVVQRNLRHMEEIGCFLLELGMDRICFNVMMAKGRGESSFSRLMPRYSEVSKVFQKLMEALDGDRRSKVALADIPLCTVAKEDRLLYFDQERFDQFEPKGSSGIDGISSEDLLRIRHGRQEGAGESEPDKQERVGAEELGKHERAGAEELFCRMSKGSLLHEGSRYYMTSRKLKDDLLRVHGDCCRGCVFLHRCPGVWAVYIEHHGWEEFGAVKEDE